MSKKRGKSLDERDALTDLPNKNFLFKELNLLITEAVAKCEQVAVLAINISHFKNIIDNYSMSVGDSVLQAVVNRFNSLLLPNMTLGRVGGDNFFVILPLRNGCHEAGVLADRIIKKCSEPLKIDEEFFKITLCVGIVVAPDDACDPEVLFKYADLAMEKAQKERSKKIAFFNKAIGEKFHHQFIVEHDLYEALLKDEFILYYQPEVDIETGEIIGTEALLRWQSPERGLIDPEDFIQIAIDSFLILQIGEKVLIKACQQNKAWQKMGLKKIPVAVNVAAIQFEQADFLSIVKNALAKAQLDSKFLELELTERSLMTNAEENVRRVKLLRELGVKFAIDDFGTGYSSLSYLCQFQVDKLKIDISFTQKLNSDPHAVIITNAIIEMAKALKMKVIAEGVETKEQLTILRSQRCDEIQGFYFSKPLPADDFEKLLKKGCCLKS